MGVRRRCIFGVYMLFLPYPESGRWGGCPLLCGVLKIAVGWTILIETFEEVNQADHQLLFFLFFSSPESQMSRSQSKARTLGLMDFGRTPSRPSSGPNRALFYQVYNIHLFRSVPLTYTRSRIRPVHEDCWTASAAHRGNFIMKEPDPGALAKSAS